MVATDLLAAARTIKEIDERLVTPEIARWGGGLISRAGDSWLIEFPASPAAVRFALSIQNTLGPNTPTPLRIGIHFGEVTSDGAVLHGNGINIAVRLQGIARPGGITFSASVHEDLPDDLGCEIRQIGPRLVKNIPEPVWVYRMVMQGDEDEPGAARASAIDLSHQVPGLDHRPAIAVIPFDNARGERDYEYLSDGLAEDIINGLCRVRWLPVISRNSTFGFKQRPAGVQDIGRQLGASYVVTGSVDVSGQRLRVQAWLTDAERGRLIWTERYQGELHDLFAVRDEIARGIVATIEPEFSRAEQLRSRSRSLESLDDWALVRRGVWHMNQLTREDARTARELFERALAGNPTSVEALVHLAWWHFWDVWVRRGATEGWLEMERLARRAMSLDPQDARPVMLTGIAEFMQGEPERGRRMLVRATQMNPSLAVGHASIGSSYILSGEPELAIEPLQTALRLSPNDFYIFHTLGEVAVARYMMGDYHLAIAAAEESLQVRPGYVHAHVVRIGCLARSGQIWETKAALRELRTRRPDFTIADIEWLPFIDRHWITYLAEGLVLAETLALENDEDRKARAD
jgi:TolB-like protein